MPLNWGKRFFSSAVYILARLDNLGRMDLAVEDFQAEIAEALRAYDKFVVCLEKAPTDCEASLKSLMEKAINAYVNRGPHLRHGIALDKQITIILSMADGDRPLCGIYFNLSSPYQKRVPPRSSRT